MKIAITGGTGFVGSHLAKALAREGHGLVLLARGVDRKHPQLGAHAGVQVVSADLTSVERLRDAFAGCHAVAHLAGINREIGSQDYQRVHIEGTRNVIAAAQQAGTGKLVFMSFLRARPGCGSPYHESKWAAEEMVRGSGLDYTIVKAGMVYGRGDHMLDHLSHALHTLPLLATVGLEEKPVRPLAIEDLISILVAALVEDRLSRQTVAAMGAEELFLSEAVRRVARVLGRRAFVFPAPVWFHYGLARVLERVMKVPLASRAQVRILSEGVVEPAPFADALPPDLMPVRRFTGEQIARGLPEPARFGLRDLGCCRG